MPIDPSIYSLVAKPSAGPLEQQGQVLNLRALMDQSKLHALQTQKLEGDLAEEQSTKDYFKGLQPGQEADVGRLISLSPKFGVDYQGKLLKNKETQGNIDKGAIELTTKAVALHRDQLADVSDPQSAAQWVQAGFADPHLAPILGKGGTVEQALARIPQDPAQFQQWKQQNALGATKYIEMNKPHVLTQDAGGTSNIVSTPGLGGAPTVLSTTEKTQTPDSKASQATAIRGQNMTDARAREMNGILEGHGTADLTPTATAIANHDIPLPNPPSGSRNPMAMVRYNDLVKKVKEINPTYNAPDYAASLKGVKDFGTGPYGQKVESSNTALNHLATLKGLAEAQKNGNLQLFNKIANEYGAATGQTAPTNLQAAITMVAPEIVKAVSGAGGGVEDRAKAAGALNPNYSPQQFLGAAKTMEELFGGRLAEAKRTYERTTFRKDFDTKMLSPAAQEILKNRSKNEAAPAAPPAATPGKMVAVVKSDADFDKLPSGATFMAPDGSTRTKP